MTTYARASALDELTRFVSALDVMVWVWLAFTVCAVVLVALAMWTRHGGLAIAAMVLALLSGGAGMVRERALQRELADISPAAAARAGETRAWNERALRSRAAYAQLVSKRRIGGALVLLVFAAALVVRAGRRERVVGLAVLVLGLCVLAVGWRFASQPLLVDRYDFGLEDDLAWELAFAVDLAGDASNSDAREAGCASARRLTVAGQLPDGRPIPESVRAAVRALPGECLSPR